jgi:hypothetical protein
MAAPPQPVGKQVFIDIRWSLAAGQEAQSRLCEEHR